MHRNGYVLIRGIYSCPGRKRWTSGTIALRGTYAWPGLNGTQAPGVMTRVESGGFWNPRHGARGADTM